jgi:hypothetical protein
MELHLEYECWYVEGIKGNFKYLVHVAFRS